MARSSASSSTLQTTKAQCRYYPASGTLAQCTVRTEVIDDDASGAHYRSYSTQRHLTGNPGATPERAHRCRDRSIVAGWHGSLDLLVSLPLVYSSALALGSSAGWPVNAQSRERVRKGGAGGKAPCRGAGNPVRGRASGG